MFWKIKKRVILFLLLSMGVYGQDLTMSRLEELKSRNQISEEDYNFLKLEIDGKLKEKHLYFLEINRQGVSRDFPVIHMNGKYYFPYAQLFKILGFNNYRDNGDIHELILGKELKKVTIDYGKKTVQGSSRETFEDEDFFVEGNSIYMDSELFKDIFLDSLEINNRGLRVTMRTNFHTPSEVEEDLLKLKNNLEYGNTLTDFYYTNTRKLFDLGYMHVQLNGELTNKGDGDKRDWLGNLEYQGPLLYGDFTASYDARENSLKGLNLYYPNLQGNHFAQLSGIKNSNDKFENSFLYDKDKGYFEEGRKFVIRENVPIGSRVELIYLGATIAIEHEENGLVEFNNSEIKSDRQYTLRIHSKEGIIETKTINTSDDFNSQSVGEFQNRFYTKENKNSGKRNYDLGTYYGVTENWTMGLKYFRTPELFDEKYINVDRAGVETVYDNYIGEYPYTFILGGERVKAENRHSRPNTVEGLFQIKLPKLKLTYENGYYSNYYNLKKSQSILGQWDPYNFLRVNLGYERAENFNGEKNNGVTIKTDLTKSYRQALASATYERDIKGINHYRVNAYYTGYKNYSVRWANSISEKGKDLESTLTLYNRSTDRGIDYQFEASYHERDKEKYTFRFQIFYDNWFNFGFEGKARDNYNMKVGLDRVIDLKNSMHSLDSRDKSRVEIFTYVDANDNNKYDEGEFPIGNVEVKINEQTATTGANGKTYIYGVPNSILYNFEPKVKRPGFDVVKSKFTIKGKGGGDIEAYIPIKPLFTLSGDIIVDKDLKSEDFIVKVKDKDGETVAITLGDISGDYDISELRIGKYTLEVSHVKNRDIAPYSRPLEINFNPNSRNRVKIDFEVRENEIVEKMGER